MLRRRAEWAPLGVAGIYLVVLAVHFRDLIAHTFRNADIVSGPVIGELLSQAPAGRDVTLGNFGWYTTLWFELATKWIPFHRQLWEIFPYAFALFGIACVGWATWRVAGQWAAAIAVTALFCASPLLLDNFLGGTVHGMSWWHIALLDATLVWLASRPPAGAARWVVAVVVGIVSAAGAASDPLVAIGGVAPAALAAAFAYWRTPGPQARAFALPVAAIVAIAAVGGRLLVTVMKHDGFNLRDLGLTLSPADAVVPHIRLLVEGLTDFGNGDFYGRAIGLRGVVALACAALVLLAIGISARHAREALRRADLDRPLIVHVAFWAASAVLLVGSFVLTTAPTDPATARYAIPVLYGTAALLPLALVRHRVLVALAVSAFGLVSVAGLLRKDYADAPFAGPDTAAALEKVVAREHLQRGYAGYWDAANLMWASHMKVRVYPVYSCPAPKVCRMYLHRISSWYTPHPGTRSFLLVDPAQPILAGPDPAFGKPVRTLTLPGNVQMLIYSGDIAAAIDSTRE
jgi:hypothetical protein